MLFCTLTSTVVLWQFEKKKHKSDSKLKTQMVC